MSDKQIDLLVRKYDVNASMLCIYLFQIIQNFAIRIKERINKI